MTLFRKIKKSKYLANCLRRKRKVIRKNIYKSHYHDPFTLPRDGVGEGLGVSKDGNDIAVISSSDKVEEWEGLKEGEGE